jgi:hypothetical protein
MNELAMNLAT